MWKKTREFARRYYLYRIVAGLLIIAIAGGLAAVIANSGTGAATDADAGELWTMLGQLVLVGGGMGMLQWAFFWALTRIGDFALRVRVNKGK